jgi:hypothetical protein
MNHSHALALIAFVIASYIGTLILGIWQGNKQ